MGLGIGDLDVTNLEGLLLCVTVVTCSHDDAM